MSFQDSLAVGHVAAIGAEEALGSTVVLRDDVFPEGALLTAHHSQALHAARAERVGVYGGEMLCQLLELQKRKTHIK